MFMRQLFLANAIYPMFMRQLPLANGIARFYSHTVGRNSREYAVIPFGEWNRPGHFSRRWQHIPCFMRYFFLTKLQHLQDSDVHNDVQDK